MAIRLDKAFGGGADTWYRLQSAYDLAQAMKSDSDGVLAAARAARDGRVIAGVRAARDAYAALHGHDIAAIFADLRAAQEASGLAYSRNYDRLVLASAESRKMVRSLGPFLSGLRELAVEAALVVEEYKRVAAEATGPLEVFVSRIRERERTRDALNEVGWLSHHSVPYRLVVECEGDPDLLDRRVSDYYRASWGRIRDDMASGLADCHIDDEAEATFREALSAHEAGLYRCVCRVLFPEIERVIAPGPRVGSKKMLETLVAGSEDAPDILFKKIHNPILFNRLMNHVYAPVVTEDQRLRFERDPVPNRHATVHGRVAYSNRKQSMNVLILTNYVFGILLPVRDRPR